MRYNSEAWLGRVSLSQGSIVAMLDSDVQSIVAKHVNYGGGWWVGGLGWGLLLPNPEVLYKSILSSLRDAEFGVGFLLLSNHQIFYRSILLSHPCCALYVE